MDLFVECFNMQTGSEVVSKFLSFNVEASIHAVHSSERDQKAYLNKARSLSFNLKKNEVSYYIYFKSICTYILFICLLFVS